MYERFFDLRERPFDLTPNPRFLVPTPSHQEALSNLQYGIASRKGITLLIGEAGLGKTTVIRTAIERQPTQVHCVHLQNPALTRAEFVQMLAAQFTLSEAAGESKTALLLELEALLRERHARGQSTALIVDEAQAMPLDLLEEIRLLANLETNDEKLLSVIIAGQPELKERLNQQAIRQLKQRIGLRCELAALTLEQTAVYMAGRIRAAGGIGSRLFTRQAVNVIHERSRGIPRVINVIADNALVSGFATEQRPIGSSLVLEVCRDFDFPDGSQELATSGSDVPENGAPGARADSSAPTLLVHEPQVGVLEPVNAHTEVTRAVDRRGTLFSFFQPRGSR